MKVVAEWVNRERLLDVSYHVYNDMERPCLLFTHLYRQDRTGAIAIDPRFAFVRIDACGHVTVEKLTPEIPKGSFVECPIVPYAELVAGGSTSSGVIALPIPLGETVAYPSRLTNQTPRATTSISLRIGYTSAFEEKDLGDAVKFEGSTLYRVPFSVAFPQQRIATSEITPMVLPVRDR